MLPITMRFFTFILVTITLFSNNVFAEFKEMKEVLSVVQGNWIEITYQISYAVTKADDRFSYKDIVFICKKNRPTPGSGIRLKELLWHFREGKKIFVVEKDMECRFRDYYKILTYSR